jgi:hypothetical protein
MSRRFTPIYLSFFLVLLWVATTSNSSNPPNGRTGAPGDGLCSDCHSGGGGFDGEVSLTGVPAVATPNTTYPITVTVTNPNGAAVRAGFQWVALNSANQNTGSLTSAGAGSTVTPAGGRFYHEHNPAQSYGAGTSVSWTVNWTAPSAPANDDNLTFYAVGVIANGGGSSGDRVVTAQFNSFMDGASLPLSGNITNAQDVSCNGGNDGQATANANGGNPPYSYQWSSGSTQMTATNLSSGMNTVTITDNDFNSITAQVTIGEPSPIQLDANLIEGIDCDTPGGSATVTASGGVGNFSYSWPSGETGNTANSLLAGLNTVTVTDGNQCIQTTDVFIPEDVDIPTVTLNSGSTLTCDVTSISVSATSSDCSDCDYSWSTTNGNITSGAQSATITVDAAGDYTVTATDPENACTTTESITVSQDIVQPGISISSPPTLTCSTSAVMLDATISDCTNCTLSWTTTDGNIVQGADTTSPTVDASGTYTLTIVNPDNGCSNSSNVVISEDITEPAISVNPADLLNCNTPFATLSSTVDNCSNCILSWATTDGNITQGADTTSPTVDAGGTYVLTAVNTDNGCSSAAQIVVQADFSTPTATITGAANLTCALTSIDLMSEIDDCPDCIINWSSPDASFSSINNGEDISVDMPGTYTLEVTDPANGCSSSTSTSIDQDVLAPLVDAGSDGILNCNITQLTLSGNVTDCPDCTYNWTTLNGQIIGGANALNAIVNTPGTYTLLATNSVNACVGMDEVVVTETPAPNLSETSTNSVSCNGEADGSASVTTTSGTAPYTYIWSSGGTAATETGLSAGSYSVTSTDEDGCTDIITITITEPEVLIANASASAETSAGGDDGTATSNPLGGTPPYTYLWSDGSTTQTITDLSPAFYTVTVTDANGCTSNQTVSVSDFSCNVLINTISSNVSCNGAVDGSISIDLENAGPDVDIVWSNGASESMIDNLSAGQYSVTVTDGNNCSATASITLTEPAALNTQLNTTNVSCFDGNDGAISADVSGGTPPYTINYPNGGDGTGLTAGDYTVSVIDANGCESLMDVNITQPEALAAEANIQDVSCFGGSDGSINLDISGGTPPYLVNWPNNGDGTNLQAGTYDITITDANGCDIAASFTIAEAAQLSIIVSPQHVSCFGGSDGSAFVSAIGGTPPYTFEWSNGGDGTNLPAGDYSVSVTDANLCQEVIDFQIQEPTALTLSIVEQSPVTCLDPDGSLTVMADGGTSGYTYLWSDGTTGATNELAANASSVSVTDANNCVSVLAVELPVDVLPPNLTTSQNEPFEITCANETATIEVNIADCPECLIEWATSDGSIDGPTDGEIIVASTAGMYTVTATNTINGCSSTLMIPVIEVLPVELILNDVINVSCTGADDGEIVFDLVNGTPPFSFVWSPNIDPSQGLPPGDYEVVVIDDNECTSNISFTITEPAPLEVEVEDITPSTNGNNDGEINITVSGGVGGYTYAWLLDGMLVSEVEDPTGLAQGTYTLQLTDANGCLLEENIELDNINALNDLDASIDITLFPNPANEVLYFEWNAESSTEIRTSIFTVSGEEIWQRKFDKLSGKAERIDVSHLAAGVYWLRFQSPYGVSVKKVIIE